MEVPSGDAVVAEAAAEPALSPEQLKKANPVGRCFLKASLRNWKERKTSYSGKTRGAMAKAVGGRLEHGHSGGGARH